jgi:hypothetical protein
LTHIFKMFGTPSRITNKTGESVFKLDVNTSSLGAEIDFTADGLLYDKDIQTRFRSLQSLVLSELAKEKDLFKNPPSRAALESITPNWGFVSSGGRMIFSPYSNLISDIQSDKLPCQVDIQLKSLEISRSTIRPTWKVHYLGHRKPAIDLDWNALAVSNEEIMEVSDVATQAPSNQMITLQDPASRIREKLEAKQKIREAFAAAKLARHNAEELAANFYESYDLSDSESAFTEWLSDSDAESDSE